MMAIMRSGLTMTTTKDNEQHSLSSVVFDGGGVAWTQDQRYQGDERDCQNLHRQLLLSSPSLSVWVMKDQY